MVSREEKVAVFRALHKEGCFIIPNPWDIAAARMLSGLGFKALATTSSGYAFSVGQRDGTLGAEETLEYAARIAHATDLPVTADLEDGYSKTADGIAEIVRQAAEAGLAGFSIEDRWPGGAEPFRAYDDAVQRVGAAVEAARRHGLVLTARADGLAPGGYDVDEAIRRLRAFEALGAEVVYAPGVPDLASLRRICKSVHAPVNHVIGLGAAGLNLAQIAEAGVRRISVGGTLARAVGGAMLDIGRQVAGGDFSRLETAPGWEALRNPGVQSANA
ncbi:isocitrate lyase/phosphoenolpyruvate mutase family protein [Aquabacter sp. CN5-332]|uniref:isocitrate lyase/PEP mutase family protein n=1 Tax=Aquabacter sp. CN5-332 TaxID=3156608 RepID=UPI0032B4AA96